MSISHGNLDSVEDSLLNISQQISQVDQETIKVTALQAIFDLLHLYGLEAFQVDATDTTDSDNEDEDDEQDEEENEGEGEQGKGKQSKTAANSAVAILSGLLKSEVSGSFFF